jgi:hypothetical protein
MTARLRLDGVGFALGTGLACLMCGLLVSRGQGLVPVALLGMTGVFVAGYVSGRALLAILTVAALLQPPLGTIGPIADIKFAEVVVPLLVGAVLLRSWTGHPHGAARSAVGSGSARLLHFVVVVYAGVIVANVVRSQYLLDTANVLRPFYGYFVAFGLYFLTYTMLVRGRISVARLLQFVFGLSVVVCIIGLAAVLLHLPLNLGNLRYSVYDYGSGAVRVGFLETFGAAGLALLVVRPYRYRLALGLLFAGALVASGGRSAALGVAIAVLIYLVITRRGWPLLVTAAVLVSLPLLLPSLERHAQVQRITNINQSAFASDERALFYTESIREFKRHPIFGTGFGLASQPVGRTQDEVDFYQEQFAYGGHATYHSLLKNFGLAGFLPFVAAILVAVWRLARIARTNAPAGVFFILLTSQAVGMVAGGNGSDLPFFFVLGAAAAVLATAGKPKAPVHADSAAPG